LIIHFTKEPNMKILLLGATGRTGKKIIEEAVSLSNRPATEKARSGSIPVPKTACHILKTRVDP
jgi:putative NADH-flavin reductase